MNQLIHFSIFYKSVIDEFQHDTTEDYYAVLIQYLLVAEKNDRKKNSNKEVIPFTSFITTLETFKNYFGPSIEVKHNSRTRIFLTDQKLLDEVQSKLLQ
ncbi:hypothetical protein AMD27_17635 (plasmid) [Acinetobacter sp. TGL-Y2]|uniref:hypothetical protein n=1 Tax=Acinetobacter sp. TGL-Y2 TaxID=1407071 RepID=UPI0007A67481|nr:hypothetical protein [Acinetobacter sp. TGL-Y2]AMW80738.1 hypothetical protein AMD27_17635 [Acinetobacter sp. TGL-Y2]